MRFIKIEAEALPSISEQYGITLVPTFIGTINGKVHKKIEGVNPSELDTLINELTGTSSPVIQVRFRALNFLEL